MNALSLVGSTVSYPIRETSSLLLTGKYLETHKKEAAAVKVQAAARGRSVRTQKRTSETPRSEQGKKGFFCLSNRKENPAAGDDEWCCGVGRRKTPPLGEKGMPGDSLPL